MVDQFLAPEERAALYSLKNPIGLNNNNNNNGTTRKGKGKDMSMVALESGAGGQAWVVEEPVRSEQIVLVGDFMKNFRTLRTHIDIFHSPFQQDSTENSSDESGLLPVIQEPLLLSAGPIAVAASTTTTAEDSSGPDKPAFVVSKSHKKKKKKKSSGHGHVYCVVCDYKSDSRSTMKKHVVTHFKTEMVKDFGIKGKSCPICDYQGQYQ